MFTLDFTEADLQVLNTALTAQPFGLVAGLISRINEQIDAQTKPAPVPSVNGSAPDTCDINLSG